ncbi:MAG: hypothetical protein ACYTFP_06935, partial [Planctomycetota bacterium]
SHNPFSKNQIATIGQIRERVRKFQKNGAAILHSKAKNVMIDTMIARADRIQRFKFVAIFVSLLMAFNSVQGAVLCLGTSGHVEIESAFHECCTPPTHAQHAEPQQLSRWVAYEKGEHCGPCIDIPISTTPVKITRLLKKPNSVFLAPVTTVIASVCASNHSTPATLDPPPHFVQMQPVILLI